jgi:cytochrome c biogenesis factor
MNKTFLSGALVVLIGVLTSYFITKIAASGDALAIEKYFNNSIIIFVVVLAALSVSSFIVSKVSKK